MKKMRSLQSYPYCVSTIFLVVKQNFVQTFENTLHYFNVTFRYVLRSRTLRNGRMTCGILPLSPLGCPTLRTNFIKSKNHPCKPARSHEKCQLEHVKLRGMRVQQQREKHCFVIHVVRIVKQKPLEHIDKTYIDKRKT